MKEEEAESAFLPQDVGDFVKIRFCGRCGNTVIASTDCSRCGYTWSAMCASVKTNAEQHRQMQQEVDMALGFSSDLLRAAKAHLN